MTHTARRVRTKSETIRQEGSGEVGEELLGDSLRKILGEGGKPKRVKGQEGIDADY